MKNILLTLILSSLMIFSMAQDLRFSFTEVNNGTTSEVRVYVFKPTAGTENIAGFTANLYFNNTESTISSFDASPSTALGWSVDQGSTPHVTNSNVAIPISHSGFGTVNVIDQTITGTNVGQVPLHVLTINLDNTVGTPAQSPVYLASSVENHPALEYVGNDFIGHPVIVQPLPLPVELLSFTAEALSDETAYLKWVTTNETNSKGFEIERAQESGQNPAWEAIGWVDGAGTITTTAEYSFVDPSPYSGENLYRLKLVDIDGAITYSDIRILRFENGGLNAGDVRVYPNPTSNWIRIDVGSITGQKEVGYNLFDERGRLLKTGIVYPGQINRLNISQLAEGIYIFQLLTENQSIEKKIVKIN